MQEPKLEQTKEGKPMNLTEQQAYQWLIEHGAKQESIVFQRHSSPDFLTSIGQFEVKRIYGKKIVFTKNQIQMLETDETTFLLYAKNSDQPIQLKAKDLKELYEISILDFGDATTLKVSKRNLKRLFCLKLDPTDTYDTVITRLLDERR